MLPTRTLCQEANIEGRTYCRPKQAVILAGGRGTRLRPITNSRPKPMVSILGRPFLEYQVEQLREQGFERVLLLLGYLPHVVSQYFGDGGRWGVKIEYSVTGADDLTSSRVENARHRIDPCFLLLYCDNYWPMQMDRMWQRFQAAAKPAMITVYSNKDHYSRGSVILDAEGHVQVYDRLRTTSGLEGVEISYAILTDLALELLPQQDTRLKRQSTRRWQGRDACRRMSAIIATTALVRSIVCRKPRRSCDESRRSSWIGTASLIGSRTRALCNALKRWDGSRARSKRCGCFGRHAIVSSWRQIRLASIVAP